MIETQAGVGAGFDDDAYVAAGASILGTAEEVFAKADMIVKVKEPQAVERKMLREGQLLFTYLHLAPDPEQTRDLLASGCTAIAYETVTDSNGGLAAFGTDVRSCRALGTTGRGVDVAKGQWRPGCFDGRRTRCWAGQNYRHWWRCRGNTCGAYRGRNGRGCDGAGPIPDTVAVSG